MPEQVPTWEEFRGLLAEIETLDARATALEAANRERIADGDDLDNRLRALEGSTPAPVPPADRWTVLHRLDPGAWLDSYLAQADATVMLGAEDISLQRGTREQAQLVVQPSRGAALRLELLPNDPQWKGTQGYRVELQFPDFALPGSVRRYRWQQYFPTDWNPGDNPRITWGETIVGQLHAGGTIPPSPMWALRLRKPTSPPLIRFDRKDLAGRWQYEGITAAFEVARWYEVEIEALWSIASDGYMIWRIDGEQAYRFDGPTMLALTRPYFKLGLYGEPARVLVRAIEIATLRDA